MLFSSIKYLASLTMLLWTTFSTPLLSLPDPNFEIIQAKLQLRDNIHYLHVDTDFGFSEPVLTALHNGVMMVIVLEVEIYQARSYIKDNKLAERDQRFTLEYFALSEQYVVINTHTGAQHTAMTLRGVINKLRDIKPIAVIDSATLDESESYYAKIRVRLSLNSLPVPLQLKAYISTDWWLYSDWSILPLVDTQSEAG